MIEWSKFLSLLEGFGYAVLLLVCALAVSLVGGLVVALCSLSLRRWIRWPATLYVELIRGLPVLLLVMWLYFGIAEFLPLHPVAAAVLAFGICYSAFIGEVYRAGIQAVDPGQAEAARALGLSGAKTMRYVVLPQAVRNILPALGNESIALWKDTALASAIAYEEMIYRVDTIGGSGFIFMRMLTVAGVLYLVFTFLLTRVQRWLERRVAGDRRSGTSGTASAA